MSLGTLVLNGHSNSTACPAGFPADSTLPKTFSHLSSQIDGTTVLNSTHTPFQNELVLAVAI